MMTTNITSFRTYTTPETSVLLIEQEQNFTATGGNQLNDMGHNSILDEDF